MRLDDIAEGPQLRGWLIGSAPAPGVAEPELGEHDELCLLRTAVDRGHRKHEVVRSGLGDLEEQVPIAAVLEHPGILQLELGFAPVASARLAAQQLVGKFALRIPIVHAHERVRRRAVEVVPHLLGILAVIAFGTGQPEQPLFEERVATVPESPAKAQLLPAIAQSCEPVLVPAVHPAARVLMRESAPGGPVGTVVLAHRAPRAFGQVGAPLLPVGLALRGCCEPEVFFGEAHAGAIEPRDSRRKSCRMCGASEERYLSRKESGAASMTGTRITRRTRRRFPSCPCRGCRTSCRPS